MNNCYLTKLQVNEFIEKYGSPLYVFHKQEFVENFCNLTNVFTQIYPKYKIAYSYKTNYTPAICKLVKQLGGLAEVVSQMEYTLAKKVGYTANNIVFNGPIKGDALFEHLKDGGVINVDSLDELLSVVNFAKENANLVLKVAFRVNLDIGQDFISRFGVDAYETKTENSELDRAIKLIKAQPNVKMVGIHCHVGKSRSISAWENRVRIMFNLIDRYFEDVPEFIDFGSGMNSVMEPELAKQFSGYIPSFEDYAGVVAKAMAERYGNLPIEKQPWLYTEPGTTLVSGTVSFLSTVKSIKNVKGKFYATFDCSGGNMGDICTLKQLPITVYNNGNAQQVLENANFVGYTCLEHDHVYKNFNGKLGVGDIVQFRNVGSYSNVFKPPFILPNCAMIMLDENGDATLIKRKETFEDVFATYSV